MSTISDQSVVTPTLSPPATAPARLLAVDALRGLIMTVMALDHASIFIARAHPPAEFWGRTVPYYADALAFLTRFVTHLAAPGFFFLLGVSLALFTATTRRAGWSKFAIARHWLTRGVLLIILQGLVENRAWASGSSGAFNPFAPPVYFGVLYGLGAVMIVGAGLVFVDWRLLLGLSVVCVLAFEVFVTWVAPGASYPQELRLLLVPGRGDSILVYYPLIPWLGLTAFGIVFGRWLGLNPAQAYRGALGIGLVFLGLFGLVRGLGSFGNLRPVGNGDWLDFFYVVKYPPSLAFIFLTLGVNLVLLSLFGRAGDKLKWLAYPFIVLGGSALFFYIAHLYLYGFMGLALPGSTGLAAMYPWWLVGLAILGPLCWAWGKFKRGRPLKSLWRLF